MEVLKVLEVVAVVVLGATVAGVFSYLLNYAVDILKMDDEEF